MATRSNKKGHPKKPARGGPRRGAAAPAARKGERGGTAGAAAASTGTTRAEQEQGALFERAILQFHAGKYGSALALFEAATAGPAREMTHSARLHMQMCARRMPSGELSLRTPDEQYDYAITLINMRKLAEAEQHLRQALAKVPAADHVLYALALCRGLGGDLDGACRHLRRAIELQPRNRIVARNDPDFADIGVLSPLAQLLYPERAAG